MPSEAEIYDVLTEIFRDVLLHDDLILNPCLTAKEVPGWDSFKHVEIILATEERFGIRLSSRDIDGLHNVGDLARVVAQRLS